MLQWVTQDIDAPPPSTPRRPGSPKQLAHPGQQVHRPESLHSEAATAPFDLDGAFAIFASCSAGYIRSIAITSVLISSTIHSRTSTTAERGGRLAGCSKRQTRSVTTASCSPGTSAPVDNQ